MNGIHDMGGMHGFGKVEVEPDEPVFHHRWEARVFGMVQSFRGNIDAGRHSIERLDPVAYLKDGYYGRWLAAFVRGLTALDVVSEADIAARIEARRSKRRGAARRSGASERSNWAPTSVNYAREVDRAPAFAVGDAVRTRDHQPSGHTRLPAYARRRRGRIVSMHGAMVFPDDHAHGRGENPQHLYTVAFDGTELWGAEAEASTVFHIDLFESYLEPAEEGRP